MEESIGVVIATYNGEKYIEKQLQSILNQTRKPDLIVLSDGGSVDETISISERVLNESQIKHTVLQSTERLDVTSNFQKGLLACDTDIVLFSDQDDVWYEKKVEKFIKVFKENAEVTLVFSNANIVDEGLIKTGKTLWDMLHYTPGNVNDIKYELLSRNIFTGMCMAIRKRWADNLPCFPKSMLHDEFYGWCASVNNMAMYIDEPLVAYRQHINNVVGSGKYTKYKNRKQARNKIIKSTTKTARKFSDIETILYGTDETIVREVQLAKKFHNDRLRLYNKHGIKAVKCFILLAKNGYYRKYCSKTERAFVKDLFCAIF